MNVFQRVRAALRRDGVPPPAPAPADDAGADAAGESAGVDVVVGAVAGVEAQAPAPEDELASHVAALHDGASEIAPSRVVDLAAVSADGPEAASTKLMTAVLKEALRRHATDVLIEPSEAEVRVRLRIGGVLHDAVKSPARHRSAFVARLRQLASIAPKDMDGIMRVKADDAAAAPVMMRVRILRTHHGEACAIRLCDPGRAPARLDDLALGDADAAAVAEALVLDRGAMPTGVVIVASPVGGGRSTTLRALMRTIAERPPARSITLIERMPESDIAGVTHIVERSVSDGAALGKAVARAIDLDADVVVVDDVGADTIVNVLRAARLGRLLIVGFAARDAIDALASVVEAGSDYPALADALRLVVAQRLQPIACNGCAGSGRVDGGVDCPTCTGNGSTGRAAVFDVVAPDDELRKVIGAGAKRVALRAWHAGARAARPSTTTTTPS